jgi:hypothetical protein
MKTSQLSLTATIVLGLAAPTWAQSKPGTPEEGGVRQDSPGRAVEIPSEETAKTSTGEIDVPKIEYPQAETEAQKKAAAKHGEGSQRLAVDQDELSAAVLGLIEEQTDEKVIQLLEQVEEIMAEVTDSLDQTNTGGDTIAAQTDIIEKIFEAAKQKSQSGKGSGNGAMLDMMQRMMGEEPQPGPGQGDKPGQGAGEQGGEGQTGESDSPNKDLAAGGEGSKAERRFQKAGGKAGTGLPPEFQKALEAYNKR